MRLLKRGRVHPCRSFRRLLSRLHASTLGKGGVGDLMHQVATDFRCDPRASPKTTYFLANPRRYPTQQVQTDQGDQRGFLPNSGQRRRPVGLPGRTHKKCLQVNVIGGRGMHRKFLWPTPLRISSLQQRLLLPLQQCYNTTNTKHHFAFLSSPLVRF